MRKKKRVPNPHDAFFRRTLARPQAAAEFLRLYLPAEVAARLDLTRIKLEDTSFVDDKLREHFSDLLYNVGLQDGRTAYVYFLLEHKSAPEERVILQVLRYLAQAWDRLPTPLPLIVPVVVYHGASVWNVGQNLRSLFAAPATEPIWQRYLPDFEYHLCDLSQYRDEDLQGGEGLAAALKLLKYIFRRNLTAKLPEIFETAVAATPEPEAKTRVQTMIHYLTESERATEPQISKALFEVNKRGRMEITLESLIRKHYAVEIQQKAQEAQQATAADLTLEQLRILVGRLDNATIEQIRALPLASLKRLGKALLHYQSRADLDAWLRRSKTARKR